MAKLQKYLFDLDFEMPSARAIAAAAAAAVQETVDIEPPPPSFSEEELALARDQAYEAGRQAGVQEAEGATQRYIAAALGAITNQLDAIANANANVGETMLQDGLAVTRAVLHKLHPELARRHALDEIVGMVAECLGFIDREIKVTLRLHPGETDAVREMIDEAKIGASFRGSLDYIPDPRIDAGDCRVEWGDGGAERNQAWLWAEIDKLITRALGVAPEDGAAQGASDAA